MGFAAALPILRADWPHSSFHQYVRLGILPVDWAGIGDCEFGVDLG